MSKSIKSTFSANSPFQDEINIDNGQQEILEIQNSMDKDDILSFERKEGGEQNHILSKFIDQQNVATSSQLQFQKNLRNYKNMNQGSQNNTDQQDFRLDEHFIYSSPVSNAFKSNEDLIYNSSLLNSHNVKKFEFDKGLMNSETQNNTPQQYNKQFYFGILDPTLKNSEKFSEYQQKLLPSERQQGDDDDFNYNDTPASKDAKLKQILIESRETDMNNQLNTNTERSPKMELLTDQKYSLHDIISNNQNTTNQKSELDSSLGNNQQLKTLELKTVQSKNEEDIETSNSKQANSFFRKLTNAQSMNLNSSKGKKKFFARKSEFGLVRSTQNGEQNNPMNQSSKLNENNNGVIKEIKDRSLQLSVLEKIQQKNRKFGLKSQRSDSVASSSQLDLKQSKKQWGIVNKLCIMIKAKHKLKNLIRQRFISLSGYQRKLIGDYADGKQITTGDKNEKPKLIQRFINYAIHPDEFPIILLKVMLLIVTVCNLIYLPIVLGFDLEISNLGLAFITFSSILYIAEIVIKFKTSLYEKGELITNTQVIAKKYLQNGFVTDVISIVGLMLGSAERILFTFMIFRFLNVIRYKEDLNYHYFIAEKFNNLWVLSGLFGFIFLMCHYFACIFHFIGHLSEYDHNQQTWIKYEQIQDQSWAIRYNYALYFSFITCMTIGYGDVIPKNTAERTAVIIFSFLSTMCFSYSVNIIGNIFQDYFNKFQKQFIMRYNAINFMDNRQIGRDLQLRVLKYIEYIHDIQNDSPDKGLSVINQISKNLKTQIYHDYYGKKLLKEKQFSLNFSKESILKLTLKIKERLYGPGEVIFEQNEQDFRLYFLMKGECEFYQQNKGGSKSSECKIITQMNVSKFFGYKGFISGIPREMSCRSVNISHVFVITRQDLIEVLKEDPQDYEQFCKLRDEYLLYRNTLGEQCFGCKNFGHTLSGCPQIHLIKNKELIIFRNNFSVNQKRVRHLRNKRKKYLTLTNKTNTSEQAQKYRIKTIDDLRKIQFQDEYHNTGSITLIQGMSDKKFSKMYPYVILLLFQQYSRNQKKNNIPVKQNVKILQKVKFKNNEMSICDNYSQDELSDYSEDESDNSTSSDSESQSCQTISEEEDDDDEQQSNENNNSSEQDAEEDSSQNNNNPSSQQNIVNSQNKIDSTEKLKYKQKQKTVLYDSSEQNMNTSDINNHNLYSSKENIQLDNLETEIEFQEISDDQPINKNKVRFSSPESIVDQNKLKNLQKLVQIDKISRQNTAIQNELEIVQKLTQNFTNQDDNNLSFEDQSDKPQNINNNEHNDKVIFKTNNERGRNKVKTQLIKKPSDFQFHRKGSLNCQIEPNLPLKSIPSILKQVDESSKTQYQIRKEKSPLKTSKTMVQSQRQPQRQRTDSPNFSRQSTKKFTEHLNKNERYNLKKLSKMYSKTDHVAHYPQASYEDNPDFLIRDFQTFRTTPSQQQIQKKLLKTYSFIRQNPDAPKLSLKQINERDKDLNIPFSQRDLATKFYEKQNQQLHNIILNMIKTNSIYSYAPVSQKKIGSICIPNEEQEKADQNMQFYQSNSQTQRNTLLNTLNQTTMLLDKNKDQDYLQELFIFDFDVVKEFKNYFPHNNASNVCQQVKLFLEKKKKVGKILFQKLKLDRIFFNNLNSKISTSTPKTKI